MTFSFPLIASVPKPLLAAILLAVGVSGALFVYGAMSSPHQTVIPFHFIAGYDAAGYPKPAYFVINDPDTWVNVWTRAYCTPPSDSNTCGTHVPQVNFANRTVIAVFMGGEPLAPGYRIKITQVVRVDSTIAVHVSLNEASCPTATLLTYPSYVVDIPKTKLQVNFLNETFYSC